jgi:hypothetical protein
MAAKTATSRDFPLIVVFAFVTHHHDNPSDFPDFKLQAFGTRLEALCQD